MRRKKLREPATREILEIRIADLSRGGAGVGRDASGRAIFVPLTAPGDLARVEIVGTEKRYAQARLLELLESSPERREPRCRVFGRCGGCQWQHLDYSLQWRTKVSGVRHALTRVQVPLAGPLSEFPAERIFEYRNRVQLRGQGRELGFYAAGSNEVVPIERCEIARPEINAALDAVRAEGAKLARPFKVEVEVLADTKIRSTWNSAHAASGFRQVHDEQNELLKKWVSERIPDGALVLDLYGGQGNLTRGLAPRVLEVHCVDVGAPQERHPDNAPRNLHFHRQAVRPWLVRQATITPAPSGAFAILDPPREGLAEDFPEIARRIEELGVREILAVGCDPDAWVRDVSRFVRRGWRLEEAAVLDLFPQTAHVESLGRIRKL